MRRRLNARGYLDRAIDEAARKLQIEVENRLVRTLLIKGIDGAAADLGVSERTLRRSFAGGRACVSDLLLEVRRRAAIALLRAGATSEEIALALGYSSSRTLNGFLQREFGERVRDLKRKAGCPEN